MAGLPCDTCQEDSTIVLRGEAGLDGEDELIYRRWRVCLNPNCERYLHRRTSVEYYPEDQGEPKVYELTELKRAMDALGLRPNAPGNDLPMLPWGDGVDRAS
ncbi:hypothetical protein DAETH_28740 [Deinococcus aetherius]|uniref:Zinc finger Ogr/Delta-type domain-containing protein n=1 Tax=Deinococcus aetherius TaxID=200252 RepID=A0ABM8AGI0_9DEIO|nr:hypothetical protein [Deinococcus aetherius]BDP42905.1 hypothetical protein DAETH_28740 [Deinococcus aetherius]